MAEAVNNLADGFVSLLGGMHAGLDPEVLAETGYSRGINVTSRGGLLRTRPGFTPDAQLYSRGRFQGMAAWHTAAGAKIVAVVRGRVQIYHVETGVVQEIRPILNTEVPCYFCQAERFFVIQDGINTAIVLQEVERDVDGVPTQVVERRVEPHTIPIGTAMAFAHGRLHVSPVVVPGTTEPGRNSIVSGDIFKSYDPAACLQFVDENEYLNEGGAHTLPLEMGSVQAFAPLRNAATGTGYGGVVVFAERGAAAFDFSIARGEWKTTALGQVLYFGPGTRSPWSVTPVNGTLMYRSLDGLRLLSYAVSAASSTGDTLSMVPQSSEVSPYMTPADRSYLARVSSAVADNRMYMTVGGVDDYWFKALVVLDAARVSQVGSMAAETAYDGIWQIEGRKIGAVVSCLRAGEEVLYALLDDFRLWRLDPSLSADNGSAIRGRLVTRVLLAGEGPTLKRLDKVEVWLRDMTSDSTVTAYYRPAGYPLWASVGTLSFKVAAGSLAQRRRAAVLNVDRASAPADPVSKESLCLGQSFQFCLDFSGPLAFNMFRCLGTRVPEPATDPCPETLAVEVSAGEAGVAIGDYL